jgi:hypothetical protein
MQDFITRTNALSALAANARRWSRAAFRAA